MKENPNMDTSDQNIDELLNSFIDGELDTSERIELEQLIARDEKVSQRLRQLQKCKILVASLPKAEAPAEILENLKVSLVRRTHIDEEVPAFSGHIETKYLRLRKVLSAAAMIALAAFLSAVFYSILTPQTVPESPVAVEDQSLPAQVEATEPGTGVVAASRFSGRLELKTAARASVAAFLKRAIEDNGLSDSIMQTYPQDRRIYSLSCSRKELSLLLAEMGYIWPRLDTATLFVNTDIFGQQIAVEAVTTEQITEIINQNNPQKYIELAKDFAVMNDMTEHLPGREILSAIDGVNYSVAPQWLVPKPILTGKREAARKSTVQARDKEKVHLTIVVD